MRTTLTRDQETEEKGFKRLKSGLVRCEDGNLRPEWAAAPGILRDYYDTEWGVRIDTEQGVYERLCLEGFQAGLSWKTILQRRPAFREAFADFDPDEVARFTDDDVELLLMDPTIIRNRKKIQAVIANAQAMLRLRDKGADLAQLLWSYAPKRHRRPRTTKQIKPITPESLACSKHLKREGFRFVGPTTVMSTMEAIGIFDMHVVGAYSPV